MKFPPRIKIRPHVTVSGVDDIHRWHTNADKRSVIVNDARLVLEKVAGVTKLIGGLRDEVLQQFAGARLFRDFQVSIAYHVKQEQATNSRNESVCRQLSS